MIFKKFLNKKEVHEQTTLNDEDITLLAFMCSFCAPDVTKKGVWSKHYAYYIPTKAEYLDIAKDLFEKNGIDVQLHYSFIMSKHGQDVLRMRYKGKKDYELYKGFFTGILRKSEHWSKEEELKVAQQVQLLKENRNNR